MENMKKTKQKKIISQPDIKALQSTWAVAKKAVQEFQEVLLQADIPQALEFWLYKARLSFQDRGTISNYHAYVSDLLERGILSHSQANSTFRVFELNDCYDKIIERINESDSFKINDRRYRVNALLAFTKFLNLETGGKVRKLTAPPMLMPVDDALPVSAGDSSKPQVLTKDEFCRLSDVIKSPRQRDSSNLRDYIVIELMFQTARPLLDILALQKANINLPNLCIIFSNKSKESLSVPITPKLKTALEMYLECSHSNRKDETVFITREGNPIFRTHFYQLINHASTVADLGFTATFKMIQWARVAMCIDADKSVRKIMKELKLKKIPKYLEVHA